VLAISCRFVNDLPIFIDYLLIFSSILSLKVKFTKTIGKLFKNNYYF